MSFEVGREFKSFKSYLHEIKFLENHGKISSNEGIIKRWRVKYRRWKCRYDPAFLKFDLLSDALVFISTSGLFDVPCVDLQLCFFTLIRMYFLKFLGIQSSQRNGSSKNYKRKKKCFQWVANFRLAPQSLPNVSHII